MYHPRSSAHGDKLCELVLEDLLKKCDSFSRAAREGRIVYKLNYVIDKGSPTQWNLDLVVGPPMESTRNLSLRTEIAAGTPKEIWLALDAKTIMTEHGKTRRNRQRDLNSLHDILHDKNPKTIVAGLVVLNMASRFKSPLRPEITNHKNVQRLVKETVTLLSGLKMSKQGGPGLDALGIIVVSHSNIAQEPTKLITTDPAPQAGQPIHYSSFLIDICHAYDARFSSS